jgi:hypothetical protein
VGTYALYRVKWNALKGAANASSPRTRQRSNWRLPWPTTTTSHSLQIPSLEIFTEPDNSGLCTHHRTALPCRLQQAADQRGTRKLALLAALLGTRRRRGAAPPVPVRPRTMAMALLPGTAPRSLRRARCSISRLRPLADEMPGTPMFHPLCDT